MREHICNVCEKNYASANSLWIHNNKYHNTEVTKNKSIKKKIIVNCQHCNKQFNNCSNRTRHEKTCKSNPTNIKSVIQNPDFTLEIVKNLIPEIINGLSINQENISKLQPQIAGNNNISNNPITNSNNPITNNNQITNNSNNSNNSNNNIIISLGNENLSDVISKNDKIKILKQKNDSLLEIIKLVHFGSKYPQFNNIAIQEGKAYQYSDIENKFLETSKENMLYELIENRVNDIYDFNEENKLSISKKIYGFIRSYTNMFEIETKLKRNIDIIEPIIESETNKLVSSNKIKIKSSLYSQI
jgi:hypothetical protein